MKEITIFIMFLLVTIFFFYKIASDKNGNDEYFENLNLKMVAVITDEPDCTNGYNGFCVLDLHVLQSNIKYYDLRNKADYYYGIIKNDKAEIYQEGVRGFCKKGDTIFIDSKDKTFHYKGGWAPMILYHNAFFYDYIAKYHQKL